MRWVLLLLGLAGPAWAEAPSDFAWQPRPGAEIPQATAFRDEAGRAVTLREAFDGTRPVVLDIGYFHCPTLCGVVRGDLLQALRGAGLPEAAYRLVIVSIDPAETPADAAAAHKEDGSAADALYLTGSATAIGAVSDAVGFRSRYDTDLKQFLHPVGAVVLTGDGRVSATLLGVGYSGDEMRADLVRAAAGGVAAAPNPVLLLCFHFDQATGRYTLAIEKVLRVLAGLTVLTLLGLFWRLGRR